MRETLAAVLLVTLLAGCGAQAPVQAPPAPTPTSEKSVAPSLDPHSRQLLDQARAAGKQKVTVLVLATPEAVAGTERALRALGANVLSVNGPTGSLRAEVPTDAVAQVSALPSVTAVQLDEDIKREEPTP
jgi:predicted small lipoprotein YifL